MGCMLTGTGESSGYYADYVGDKGKLARALAQGFAFQGEFMPYRKATRGEPSAHLPPVAFISFTQNHDQIGNRAFGERLNAIAPPAAVMALGAVYLMLPRGTDVVMVASGGFLNHCVLLLLPGSLGKAVAEGRRGESLASGVADPPSNNASRSAASETFESAGSGDSLQKPEHPECWKVFADHRGRHRESCPDCDMHGGGEASAQTGVLKSVRLERRPGADRESRRRVRRPGLDRVGRTLWQQVKA